MADRHAGEAGRQSASHRRHPLVARRDGKDRRCYGQDQSRFRGVGCDPTHNRPGLDQSPVLLKTVEKP